MAWLRKPLGAALFLSAWLSVEAGLAGLNLQMSHAAAAPALASSAAPAAPAAVPAAANQTTCKALTCADVYRRGAVCQCNVHCTSYKNCCADYDSVCPGHAAVRTEVHTGVHTIRAPGPDEEIVAYVGHTGSCNTPEGCTAKASVVVNRWTVYSVSVETAQIDMSDPSEKLKSISVGGVELGGCNPSPTSDYDCSFANCFQDKKIARDITSDGIVELKVRAVLTHDECRCDHIQGNCYSTQGQETTANPTYGMFVRFTLTPTGLVEAKKLHQLHVTYRRYGAEYKHGQTRIASYHDANTQSTTVHHLTWGVYVPGASCQCNSLCTYYHNCCANCTKATAPAAPAPALAGPAEGEEIVAYVGKVGSCNTAEGCAGNVSIHVNRKVQYAVTVHTALIDMNHADEKLTSVSVGGHELGECNVESENEYNCSYAKCFKGEKLARDVTSSGIVELKVHSVFTQATCQCDRKSGMCSSAKGKKTGSNYGMWVRFTLTPIWLEEATDFVPGASCQCTSECRSFNNCCADCTNSAQVGTGGKGYITGTDTGVSYEYVRPTGPTGKVRTDVTWHYVYTSKDGSPESEVNPPLVYAGETTTQLASTITSTVTTASTTVTTITSTTTRDWLSLYRPRLSKVTEIDIYRAMQASHVDMHPLEDDNVADVGGVLKYIATEIVVESRGNPSRTTRKYDINSITRHRFKVRNPDALLESSKVAYGEFGRFVTYDSGKANNQAVYNDLKEFGDFVGVQGCSKLKCDARYPSTQPYSWLSFGNWCPNLSFDKKGTKSSPSKECMTDNDEQSLFGGLCPNGFNADGVSPPMDPTGERGCVYSYGRGQTILLDELVGITNEDCGETKCKNWLHFRNNCSNPKYKRMFTTTGEVVKTNYCVEHDIHPKCQADCGSPGCQELLRGKSAAYLGLPFWNDICDPRANIRRQERVAYAFGRESALTKHLVVEESLTKTGCRASVGTEFRCVPTEEGAAGPFCTRYFNGMCEPCYIPGTIRGPERSPACPLDVYESYQGIPKPRCKSRKATDGCCLYDGTCEGSSDPSEARLDSDGYALVAARRSTEDMTTFMKRIVTHMYPKYTYVLEDKQFQSRISYAAYSAWSVEPTSQSLSVAFKEFRENLKGALDPPSVLTLPGELFPWQCFDIAVSFTPLDMQGESVSLEGSALACQQRCQLVEGCAHFTFMPPMGQKDGEGSCHLQDISAEPVEDSIGYVAGPYKCWEDIEHKAALVDIGYQSFVRSDLASMERGVAYPAIAGRLPQVISEPTHEGSIRLCMDLCHGTPGCERYTIAFPQGLCSFSSSKVGSYQVIGAVSGPPVSADSDITGAREGEEIVAYVGKVGSCNTAEGCTSSTSIEVNPRVQYAVSVQVALIDMNHADEKLTSVSVGGHELGECNVESENEYNCSYARCFKGEKLASDITSSGVVELKAHAVWTYSACHCERASGKCYSAKGEEEDSDSYGMWVRFTLTPVWMLEDKTAYWKLYDNKETDGPAEPGAMATPVLQTCGGLGAVALLASFVMVYRSKRGGPSARRTANVHRPLALCAEEAVKAMEHAESGLLPECVE